ncbi:30S ribosomal protein S3 [Rickettsiales endosymbiont of Peranema trichophorum]|uniref:30S ribosomal protein S3 n=1 Tax=Rickettsiales endosymbiont of Peranema trichophorum TaxID=2486577 RepID=UPI001023E2EA|nr:30S ribosomal protein S3 [Rickettsiales endosymbiont of Peranema trichophorum]RZI45564.1 30S ribosomal protein S3 [Rickettsiales endosymbiont of Peranema trichophorum]
MGQKVNPIGLRLGIIKTWDSLWYVRNGYADKLLQDLKIRSYVSSTFAHAGVSAVRIERSNKKMKVVINTSKPGVIIGKKGADIEKVKEVIRKLSDSEVSINIVEEKRPELNAVLVAQSIAQQLEKRVVFRKAAKRAMQSALRMGAKGIKVSVAGRLGGVEIARTEWYKEGRVPLHTLRADIDYHHSEAHTTYGVIGVKVWVYKGDKLQERAK